MAKNGRVGAGAAAALACALLSAGAAADPTSSLWKEAAPDPTREAYEAAMADGDAAAVIAAERVLTPRGPAIADAIKRAVAAYQEAAAIDPKAAEPHYRAGQLLYAHYVSGSRGRPDPAAARRVLRRWERFERLAPRDPRLSDVLFSRSITYTMLGGDENYRKAIADYEQILRLIDTATTNADQIGAFLTNAAEVYMALGELDRAITLYRQAIDFNNKVVYGYGLALALERDGQRAKAREVMAAYLGGDQLKALHEQNYFFIPDGDIHAYQALGFEVLGDRQQAIREYRLFLRAQPDGRYSEPARRRLEALERGATPRDRRAPERKP